MNQEESRNLSVVITTFDRVNLLRLVLKDLRAQVVVATNWEVIVVDNAGQAACSELVIEFGYLYVHETQVGLSHARNRGLKEATYDWVLYLDDDVRLPSDIINRFSAYLPGLDGAAFGGRFEHWYLQEPPEWLKIEQGVGTFPSKADAFGVLPEGAYLIGCFFAVHKIRVTSAGSFDVALGMKGKEVGWADETELQVRLRRAGHHIYYAPDLVIRHLVQPWKCSLQGQISKAYSLGKNKWVPKESNRGNWFFFSKELLRITFVVFPVTVVRWLVTHREWYWQNFALRIVPKYAFLLGLMSKRWKVYTDNF